MRNTIRVRLKRAEGSLLRTLGLVNRRSFEVVGVAARLTDDERWLDAELTLESDRSIDVLCRQIDKLFDVVRVERVTKDTAVRTA